MESLPRKRKGARSLAGSLHDAPAARKRTCKEPKPRPEKKPSSGGGDAADAASAPGGLVLTAPSASGRAAPESPGRGLKRKLGCIESATLMGRKKWLEIGQGKFSSVRIRRAKAGGEEFACKALPKNGEEAVHRELCSGGGLLDEMAREDGFSEQCAAIVIKDLVAVVKYCHELGVVHRVFKPENILLTKSGKMKLADFGLAARVSNGLIRGYVPVCAQWWRLNVA